MKMVPKMKCMDYPFYRFLNQQLKQISSTNTDSTIQQQFMEEINAFQKRIALLNRYIQKISKELVSIKITGDGCGTYLMIKTAFFINQKGILDLGQFVDRKDTYYYNNQHLIHKSVVDLSDVPKVIKIRFGETPVSFKICNYYPFAQLLALNGSPIKHLYPDSENYVNFEPCDFGIVSQY
ncbi:hypothetical protein ACYATM_05915 [Lactobacillaceae bacterium Scapto_B20]